VRAIFVQTLKQIQNLNSNTASDESQYKDALENFSSNYASGRLIDSHSLLAESIKEIKSTEPSIAARVLAILTQVPFEFSDTTVAGLWFRAAGVAETLSRGQYDQGPALSASLSALRKDWDSVFQGIEAELRTRQQSLGEQLSIIQSQWKSWESKLGQLSADGDILKTELTEKTSGAIESGATQIEDFKKAYNQALALRAPTQYWRDKQIGHRWVAAAWFVEFGLSAAAGVYGVWYVWHITIEMHLTAAKDAPSYTVFLPSIGSALLAAWFMRMFSRQVLSNLALSADASERVAMVKTYLALTEGGHAQESDRGLILSSLFRSAAKTTDDAAPPTVADVATRILRGERP